MSKTTDSVIFSATEREILETVLRNPELSNAEVADKTGYRLTIIRDTRSQYADDVVLADDATAEPAADQTETISDTELNERQHSILEVVRNEPGISNAEIADKTGARITLIRDTRDQYGDAVDNETVSGESTVDDSKSHDGTNTTETTDDSPTDTQAAIIELAANNPELTNAEIADKTNTRVTLVRDTRSQYGNPQYGKSQYGSNETNTERTVENGSDHRIDEIDTQAFSETQQTIVEAALNDPGLTNAEIADKTGTRVTLVRDTIFEYESDDEPSTDTADAGDDTDMLADVDAAAFSGTQLDILETALSNPDLTTAEIAAETGTRITLVRDTIFEHEYDEKPWDSKPVKDEDDTNEVDEETEAVGDAELGDTEAEQEAIELPETTAADVFSEIQRVILETALENPDQTNAEIANEIGTRLTLVRDTRETYEATVDLPEDSSGGDRAAEASSGTNTDGPSEPTERQRTILHTAAEEPELTNAEIADRTGARIALVRDTRAQFAGEVDLSGAVDAITTNNAGATNDTGTTDDAETVHTENNTETAASAESAAAVGTDSEGTNRGVIVAILIAILLGLGVARSLGVI